MISFFDVLITVIFLLLLAIPGYIFAKLKMLPKSSSETLSTLVLYGCQPVLIIVGFQGTSFKSEIGWNMLLVAALALVLHLVMIAIVKLAFIKKEKDEQFKIIKYMSVFSNCAFMGVPFLQSLFTDPALQGEVLIYCSVVVAVFNVLTWTFGVYMMTGDKKQVSIKKVLLNPVIIAVAIGLLLFVTVQKPLVELATEGTALYKTITKFMSTLNFIANTVTPLSMFVIGIRLANISLKQLFIDGRAYISAAMKLLVMPIITMFSVAFLPISATIKYTLFFLLAMPGAASGVMLAVKFDKDGDFASVCVLLSTVLCVATIPPLYLFMNTVLGIPI